MKKKLGWCITGSFCTFKTVFEEIHNLTKEYDIIPIMSSNAANINTRFGEARYFIEYAEDICKNKVIMNIENAEPIGPKNLTDIMLIAPCTGNTLAKLANSITDTSVTMAIKSHLRNFKPVVIALSTNDALAGTMKNIATISNTKNYYFVPLNQDDPEKKPTSLAADFTIIGKTLDYALNGKQIQPFLY